MVVRSYLKSGKDMYEEIQAQAEDIREGILQEEEDQGTSYKETM